MCGPQVGVDVDERCARFARPAEGLHIAIGSQLNASFLLSVCAAHGPFDVIIDDAAHMAAHIRGSLAILFPADACMTNRSVYVVEDMHTMMMPSYHELGPSEFDVVSSEAFRSMMRYWYPHLANGGGALVPAHPIFGARVAGVHLYDSIAFIERGPPQPRLTHLKRGRRSGAFPDHSTPQALRRSAEYREAAAELRAAVQRHAAPLPAKPKKGTSA